MNGPRIALDLDWAEVDRIVTVISGEICSTGPPEVVVGVLGGGMAPAIIAAHQLGVETVHAITVHPRSSRDPDAARAASPIAGDLSGPGSLAELDVLLVDDVAASGATLRAATRAVRHHRPARLRTAVVAVNTGNWTARTLLSDPLTLFDHVGTASRGWVRFPWETR